MEIKYQSLENLPTKPKKQNADRSIRKRRDTIFLIIPYLLSIFQICTFCYTFFLVSYLKLTDYWEKFGKFIVYSLIGAFSNLITLPLYSLLLIAIKTFLVKIILGLSISFIIIPFIVISITCENFLFLIPGGFCLLIFLAFLACFRNQFKLSQLTSSNFLTLLEHFKIIYIFTLIKAIIATTLVILTASISVMNSLFILFETQSLEDYEYLLVILIVCLILSLIVIIFFLQFIQSLSIIYGAAIYNQYLTNIQSLDMCERVHGNITIIPPLTNTYLKEAHRISFQHSLGSVCLSSVFLSITSFLRLLINTSSKENSSIVTLIFRCICRCILDLIDSLTVTALLYCALYGKSLIKSGSKAVSSFKSHGITRLLNVWFIGNVLDFFAFIIFLSLSVLINSMIYSTLQKDNIKSVDITVVMVCITFGVFLSVISMLAFNCLITGGSNVQISIYVEDPKRLEGKFKDLKKMKKYLGEYYG